LPIFSWCNGGKYTNGHNICIPNGHNIYQMATIYTKWP
jgi:hypothetical protein